MPSKKKPLRVASNFAPPESRSASSQPPTVSPQWLLRALAYSAVAALLCAWATLCLLFWQGSWQLLYHPKSSITRTPASVGIAYEPVAFAATETGELRLRGWWIPAAAHAPNERLTVLYLHNAQGNLSDTVDALARLHAAGANVFAFDYRGYGQSSFVRPSEASWQQDANWALNYLIGTRHIDAHSIVLAGEGLGADLALEIAAVRSDLAGVILQSPLESPGNAIFNDARAQLVPAHLLVHDRYDIDAAAGTLRIPSLWFLAGPLPAYAKVSAPKQQGPLSPAGDAGKIQIEDLARWLSRLAA